MTTIADRFWANVDRNGPIHPVLGTRCWLWTGHRIPSGYGRINRSGRLVLTHRLAWELAHGPIPPGDHYGTTCVLHKCDNPPCCNEAHLFLGTPAENNADRDAKGRQSGGRGESSRASKMTDEKVREARRMADAGAKIREIAAALGCSLAQAHKIARRKAWSHVA